MRLRYVALGSLLFTYLFFIEYLSPFRNIHVPFDLQGYHYTLADYAFQSLSDGHFPEWDSSIYSGVSFVANAQAALFYPPTWIMLAANWGRDRLSYQSLEILLIAHVWVAFLLCFLWLRGRKLTDLAALMGAGVFAFSGYVCLQLQHFGLVGGYAWFPLGLMGIDESFDRNSWRPMWKLVVASALCFLAGYPPTWFVFAVCMGTYAIARPWRLVVIAGTVAGLAASLLIAMVQVLPSWEASTFMLKEARYGNGIHEAAFFLSYLFPNFFNFGMDVPVLTNYGKEYLYLGAPAFFGIVYLFRRRNFRVLIAPAAVGVVSLILVTNPDYLVWKLIQHSGFLAEVCRSYYFLAGITLSAASLAAYGLDDFLRRSAVRRPIWFVLLTLCVAAAWIFAELWRYAAGIGFAAGWKSVYDPLITLVIFALTIYVWRGQKGPERAILVFAILLLVGVDYKVFGTRKRFNAQPGAGQPYFSDTAFANLDPSAYRQMRAHPQYRVLVDPVGLFPLELRHAGLRTPQGFDPFFTAQYRQMIAPLANMRSNWMFDVDPANEQALHLLGIRYVITSSGSDLYKRMPQERNFHVVGDPDMPYRVFEYEKATPTYGFDNKSGAAACKYWEAETREFTVHATGESTFVLHEQFLPGWTAQIDGQHVPIHAWMGAFQSVSVPSGDHTIEFRYHSKTFETGAWVSLASLIAILALYLWPKRVRL